MIVTIQAPNTGSNCYLVVEKQKVLLIDPNQSEKIEILLTSSNWIPEKILLTHEHFDHIEGVEALRKKYQIPVLSTKETSEGIQDVRKNLSSIYDLFVYYRGGPIAKKRHATFVCEPAEETFSGDYQFQWEDHQFFLHQLPGHSPGSCMILMDDAYLFSGDYLIAGETPITRFSGGSEDTYKSITEPYLQQMTSGLFIYPGHGSSYVLTKGSGTPLV